MFHNESDSSSSVDAAPNEDIKLCEKNILVVDRVARVPIVLSIELMLLLLLLLPARVFSYSSICNMYVFMYFPCPSVLGTVPVYTYFRMYLWSAFIILFSVGAPVF